MLEITGIEITIDERTCIHRCDILPVCEGAAFEDITLQYPLIISGCIHQFQIHEFAVFKIRGKYLARSLTFQLDDLTLRKDQTGLLHTVSDFSLLSFQTFEKVRQRYLTIRLYESLYLFFIHFLLPFHYLATCQVILCS